MDRASTAAAAALVGWSQCAEHRIGAEVEIIEASYIDEAFDRLVARGVRYRFVIDASTFAGERSREGRPT